MAVAVISRPDDGETVGNPVGGHVVFKVRGEHTAGRLTAFETVIAAGQGPPLHRHGDADETIWVIEGDVRFQLADALEPAPAGSFVFIPRGVPHTFQNTGSEPARMLIQFAPAGMEHFFDRFVALGEPDRDAFTTIGAEVGMEVLGPPLAESGPDGSHR